MQEKRIGGAHADSRFVRMLGIHFTDSTGECGDGPGYSSDPPLT
ncbi:hypothetical protein FHX75_111391 [Micromonospora palomenae]|uniref:Uncharacterized protein n=1 Tax=Micromonospora palomenae TaxID=1461247 RepID=A0A561WWK6_9ACTN|nr:hypothetical protein FHX75_111391 [Micromonospora palomenae]